MAIEKRAEEPDELKKKLLRRIAVAVVLVAVLLGGLSLFDAMMTPEPAKPLAKPALPEARPQPVPAEANKAEAAKPEETKEPAKEPVKAEPEKTETPVALPPPEPPRPEAKPTLNTKPVPAPAPVRTAKPNVQSIPAAPVKLSESAPKATPQPAKPVAPLAPTKAAEAKPVDSKTAEAPTETKPAPALAVMRGFVLQMGVFTSTANAEELRAKLEKAGIPSTIEAHVQVGPFKTRIEALEAQAKLKSLGLGGGMLVPPRK